MPELIIHPISVISDVFLIRIMEGVLEHPARAGTHPGWAYIQINVHVFAWRKALLIFY